MIGELVRPYNRDVFNALHTMNPTKPPRPDGFNALFFQKYWDVVRDDLSSVVLRIPNNCQNPSKINRTYITLIPKVPHATCPSQFRPISLCNVAMKIVTKCIANRLKLVLPDLIDETQSAFVPGCLVTDNAIIAFEAFHYLEQKREERGTWL